MLRPACFHLRRVPAIAIVVATMTASTVASAQPADASVAEALFRDGMHLYDAGRTAEACAKFAESYRLDPANGTLQNLALCHEREGKLATAWSEFSLLAGRAAAAGQTDREQLAKKKTAELEPRLARVELRPTRDTNVEEVLVDGTPLSRAAWSSPLPLDRGVHVIELRAAAGKASRSVTVEIGEPGVTHTVVLPKLEDGNSHDEARAAAPPAASSPVPTYVAGAVAITALTVGAVTGFMALSRKSDADDHCGAALGLPEDRCSRRGAELDREASAFATVSTIGFVVGGAAVAAAAWLFFSRPEPRASARTGARFDVATDGRGAFGQIGGSF